MTRILCAVSPAIILLTPMWAQDSRQVDRRYPSAVVYRNVMVAMRDGVRLATDIYLPSEDGANPVAGRFPVLLTRTFYNKWGGDGIAAADPRATYGLYLTHGYAVAVQDVRGRWASEGESRPWLNDGSGEHPDGYDTAAWLVKQPWSDGRLGIFGNSYMGGTASELAVMHPPGFTAAYIEDPASDGYHSLPYLNGGTLALGWAIPWTLRRSVGDHKVSAEQRERWSVEIEQSKNPKSLLPYSMDESVFKTLPLRDAPVNKELAWWQEWLDHWEHPWYFAPTDTQQRLQDVSAPILHSGGWYSLLAPNTIAQYHGSSTRAANASVRANQRLLMGPWGHGGCAENGGCATFPGAAERSSPLLDTQGYRLAWMDRWFKGKQNPVLDHPVVPYVMGENRWRAEKGWPLPGTQMTRYYLHSGGKANTAAGNGVLSRDVPERQPPDHYSYDPHNPVPSRCSPTVFLSGMCEQSSVEARSDVLVFTTPVLIEDVEVTGEWTFNLYAASSEPSPHFRPNAWT